MQHMSLVSILNGEQSTWKQHAKMWKIRISIDSWTYQCQISLVPLVSFGVEHQRWAKVVNISRLCAVCCRHVAWFGGLKYEFSESYLMLHCNDANMFVLYVHNSNCFETKCKVFYTSTSINLHFWFTCIFWQIHWCFAVSKRHISGFSGCFHYSQFGHTSKKSICVSLSSTRLCWHTICLMILPVFGIFSTLKQQGSLFRRFSSLFQWLNFPL